MTVDLWRRIEPGTSICRVLDILTTWPDERFTVESLEAELARLGHAMSTRRVRGAVGKLARTGRCRSDGYIFGGRFDDATFWTDRGGDDVGY